MKNKLLLWSLLLSAGFIWNVCIAQESTFLAQKLMFENDLKNRIEKALQKVIDDHRYVLDVSVTLKFSPTVKEEITYKPSKKRETQFGASEMKTDDQTTEMPGKRTRFTGIPIPGFDFHIEEGEVPSEVSETVKEIAPEIFVGEREVVSETYTDITASMPQIEKMDIFCLLPEDASTELIENVRQIIGVSAHIDRRRGDAIRIQKASFKERRGKSAEEVILKSIAEKIDQLEKNQIVEEIEVQEEINWQEEIQNWQEEEANRREEEHIAFLAALNQFEKERDEEELQRVKDEMTASFKAELDKKDQKLEQYKKTIESGGLSEEELKETSGTVNILEEERAKLDSMLDAKRKVLDSVFSDMNQQSRQSSSNLPIYLMSAVSLLAVIALAGVILFNGRKPKYVMPPPWAMPRPRPKKKKKKVKIDDNNNGETKTASPTTQTQPAPTQTPPPTQPLPPGEDPSVLQSEIKSVRKSIMSMSTGQPDTATSIVKEWLQEEAPPPPEEPQQAAITPSVEEEEEGGKKKKKKKKKK
tara:strand:- start:29249 stop:30835 length:1587 start_codon:yes stop_codon:yes gene_type:complete